MDKTYGIKVIEGDFSICLPADSAEFDPSVPYCFFARTDEEISLVCQTSRVPAETLEREDGWRMFRVDENLDFSLICILSAITSRLAEEAIGVFVVSTFRTDYVLVKQEQFGRALEILAGAGWSVAPPAGHGAQTK